MQNLIISMPETGDPRDDNSKREKPAVLRGSNSEGGDWKEVGITVGDLSSKEDFQYINKNEFGDYNFRYTGESDQITSKQAVVSFNEHVQNVTLSDGTVVSITTASSIGSDIPVPINLENKPVLK